MHYFNNQLPGRQGSYLMKIIYYKRKFVSMLLLSGILCYIFPVQNLFASQEYKSFLNSNNSGSNMAVTANEYTLDQQNKGYRNFNEDTTTGLYYLHARYYDPNTRQFLTKDPAGMKNLYAYCAKDPVNEWDPTGQWEWPVFMKNFFNGLIYKFSTARNSNEEFFDFDENHYHGIGETTNDHFNNHLGGPCKYKTSNKTVYTGSKKRVFELRHNKFAVLLKSGEKVEHYDTIYINLMEFKKDLDFKKSFFEEFYTNFKKKSKFRNIEMASLSKLTEHKQNTIDNFLVLLKSVHQSDWSFFDPCLKRFLKKNDDIDNTYEYLECEFDVACPQFYRNYRVKGFRPALTLSK